MNELIIKDLRLRSHKGCGLLSFAIMQSFKRAADLKILQVHVTPCCKREHVAILILNARG